MTFCGEASASAKLCLVLLIIALGLHCGGYGSNYWMAKKSTRDKENYGIGLWKMTNCSGSYDSSCTDTDIQDFNTTFVKVVKGMESCAMILIFVAMVCMIFYVGSQRSRTRGMAISVMIITFLAALCSITGMVVWIVEVVPAGHYPGWSMGLTVFAWTLCITAGVLLIPDLRGYDYRDILKVGGEFQNLPVTREDHPPPPQERMYEEGMQPVVEPQGPLAAPVYQYLNYDKRKKRDGF